MKKQRNKTEKRELVNQGEDNEMELFGFRSQPCRRVLSLLGCIFSLGFLKLLFYWKPEWDVWSQGVPCSLEAADLVLLRTTDAFKQYTKKKVTWFYISALMKPQTGKQDQPIISEESSIVNRAIMKPLLKVRCLHVQKIRYVWDTSAQQFQKIGVLEDKYSCSEIHSIFGSGFSRSEQTVRKKICGPNTIEVDIIPVWKLLFKEVLNPFYWFQAASISLWISMGYYEYSLAIVVITLVSIIVTIHDLRQQSVNLHNLVEAYNSVIVTVCRKDGDCQEIESRHLVPGDVFLLPRKKLYLPCDAILINGSCVVDESMLTGESIPVLKIPLPNVDNSVPWKIHSQEDYKKHILFCGTELLQTKASSVAPAKAVVLQTGFNTAKGDLVRSILYSKPVYGRLYRDAKLFTMCLLVLGAIGVIYTTTVHIRLGTSAGEIVVYAILIVTIVVPPALPAGLAVGVMYAQKRLKKGGIFCISPQKITLCGWLNLVCFDKTGTLTEDGLDLWGLLPSSNRRFQKVHLFGSGTPLPWGPHLGAMASCHSLIWLDGKLQGDPLDLKMFEGTGWNIESLGAEHNNESSAGVITRPGLKAEKIPVEGIAILRQFPFSSSLQRMSVITRVIGSQEVMAFMKGAPEMVISFCKPETVPLHFSDALELYTMKGFRVIGLAYKTLQMKPDFNVDDFSREDVESSLEFLGLLVMENRLKAETRTALKELSNAEIKTVMVTGDNLQTAVTVAKNSEMVSHTSKTVLVEAKGPEGSTPASVIMQTQEDEKSNNDTISEIAINIHSKSYPKLEADEFHFAMSGASYQVIVQHFSTMLPKLLLNGVIFARMSPRQKSSLIEEFQKLDYFVGMCGDGANDCGALKMAHAGISLSEHEASVASPFTSQTPNIQCVPRLIKEGRAALVSSFCVFQYIIMNCLIAFNCVILLHWQNTFLANYQYLTQDMGIAFIAYLTITLNKACPQLCRRRPIRRLLSLPFVVSMMVHYLLSLMVLVITFVVLQQQPWYSTTDLSSACLPGSERTVTNMGGNVTQNSSTYKRSFVTTSLWIVTSFSYIIYAFVISKGKPFRKPLYTNYVQSVLLVAQIAVFLFLMFTNNEAIQSALELVCTPLYWRLSLVIMLILYFLVAYTVEEYVVDNYKFWMALKKLLNIETKSKYKILQRTLEKESNWPPLNVTQYAEKITGEPGSCADGL